MGNIVGRFCASGGLGAVGGVCCEKGTADGVKCKGEDGEDEGDQSPAGAERGDDHGGGQGGKVMRKSSGSP